MPRSRPKPAFEPNLALPAVIRQAFNRPVSSVPPPTEPAEPAPTASQSLDLPPLPDLSTTDNGHADRFRLKGSQVALPPMPAPAHNVPGPAIKHFLRAKKRAQAIEIAKLRLYGHTYEEIAELLRPRWRLSANTVRMYLYEAAKAGLFVTTDPNDHLEFNLSHKIVDVIDRTLSDATNMPSSAARKMAVKTAQGIGLFKTHAMSKAEQSQQATLIGIKIEHVGGEGAESPQVRAGTIMGTPMYVEGAVADVEPAKEPAKDAPNGE